MPALQDKTLFISAGHSHADPGAAANGCTEASIALEFRDLLADYLRGTVLFSRDGKPGQNLPLRDAVEIASRHDVSVEFHCNAATPAATGVETLSREHGYPLGQALCEAIAGTLGIPNRGAKPEGSGQHSRLAFVSDGGGVIVELFFLTSESDLSKYIAHRRGLVAAVGQVLIDAVTLDDYMLPDQQRCGRSSEIQKERAT